VDKDVFPASVGDDEAKASLRIEELDPSTLSLTGI
jgi:hypothetical protein